MSPDTMITLDPAGRLSTALQALGAATLTELATRQPFVADTIQELSGAALCGFEVEPEFLADAVALLRVAGFGRLGDLCADLLA